jgi:glycerol uptake facilitator-like aquaporin
VNPFRADSSPRAWDPRCWQRRWWGPALWRQRLAGGNGAVALLANTGATVAVLYTLITLLGPISGAHFNPAVSGVEALRGRLLWRDAGAYAVTQFVGCCAGAILAHLMFELPVWQWSTHVRSGPAQWLAEAIATFGLLLVVIGHRRAEEAPWMVACWIGAEACPNGFLICLTLHRTSLAVLRASGRRDAGTREIHVIDP